MQKKPLTIGFVRRGYSSSGGAESYLKRLAGGVVAAGHSAWLITDGEWPAKEWTFGGITRIREESPRAFADEVAKLDGRSSCDVIMSLERLWGCDVYRAGDGVHAAWLERRARFCHPVRNFLRRLRSKHDDIVALEHSLFAQRRARHVIVNSEMVKAEIVRLYGYPSQNIALVRNGIPRADFAKAREARAITRLTLGLEPDVFTVLFVGSGWERKGLRFAVEAVEKFGGNTRLVVVGRGSQAKYRSARTQFIGVRDPTALYGAADVFLLPTLYDPFSNACLEALAAGLPVITTSANGFAEIIESRIHGSVMNDPPDISSIADELRYWSDARRREAAFAANIQLASAYDISVNVRQTLQVLLQIADSAAST